MLLVRSWTPSSQSTGLAMLHAMQCNAAMACFINVPVLELQALLVLSPRHSTGALGEMSIVSATLCPSSGAAPLWLITLTWL